jgi:predicted transcriptional regulator
MLSNKVLSIIESSGQNGIDKTELLSSTRSMSKKERDDVLRDLEEAGLVFLNSEITGGKRRIVYRSTQWQQN